MLGPGVSGAGKTRLAFDMARERYLMYYDFNGGHAKISQRDVIQFNADIETITSNVPVTDGPRVKLNETVDCLIESLILGRLVVLCSMVEKIGKFSPWDWLHMQTEQKYQDLLEKAYRTCKQLCFMDRKNLVREKREEVLKYNLSLCGEDVEGSSSSSKGRRETKLNSVPLVFDEAQALLDDATHYWKSTKTSASRPLATFMLRELPAWGFRAFVCGTNLSLKHCDEMASAVGVALSELPYTPTYCFLGPTIGEREDVEEGNTKEDAPSLVIKNGVAAFIADMIDMDDNTRDAASELLRGRPRFTASFIAECIRQEGKRASDVLQEYVQDVAVIQIFLSNWRPFEILISLLSDHKRWRKLQVDSIDGAHTKSSRRTNACLDENKRSHAQGSSQQVHY